MATSPMTRVPSLINAVLRTSGTDRLGWTLRQALLHCNETHKLTHSLPEFQIQVVQGSALLAHYLVQPRFSRLSLSHGESCLHS